MPNDASDQPVVTSPRVVAFVQWECIETTKGLKEEDFCKELPIGWIPRIGDTLSFDMDDYNNPFEIYMMKVENVDWHEINPGFVEVLLESFVPRQQKQEFQKTMRSLGWIERTEWESVTF